MESQEQVKVKIRWEWNAMSLSNTLRYNAVQEITWLTSYRGKADRKNAATIKVQHHARRVTDENKHCIQYIGNIRLTSFKESKENNQNRTSYVASEYYNPLKPKAKENQCSDMT